MPGITTSEHVPPKLSSRQRYGALIAMSVGGMAIGTSEFAAMGILPDVSQGFGEPIASTGAIVAIYALGVVVGAPLLTAFGARLQRRTLLIGLMLLFLAASVFSVFAPNFSLLLVARFFSGLPHGAFFGIATVVASKVAPHGKRSKAIALVMSGITVAAILAAPVATFLSQTFTWRAAFLVTSIAAIVSVLLIMIFVPDVAGDKESGFPAELRSIIRPQVAFTLAVVSFGFGGVFAVYSYVAPIIEESAGMRPSATPMVLAFFGVGMAIGNQLGGIFGERAQNRTITLSLLALIVVLATFPLTMIHPVTVTIAIVLIGISGFTMIAPLTARMIDSAGPAKSLAASLNQAGFNLANALGAWLAGLVIAAGLGWSAPAWVGIALALLGFMSFVVALKLNRP